MKIEYIFIIKLFEGENSQGQPHHSTPGAGSTGQCLVGCLGKTKRELQTFGTSRLRPEAAAHRVHNASRKPKDQVRPKYLRICKYSRLLVLNNYDLIYI